MKHLTKILSNPLFPYIFLLSIIAYILNKINIGSLFDEKRKPVTSLLSTFGATITETQAKSYADSLYIYMADNGTEEEDVYSVLSKLKNQKDFNKVYNAFGKRLYIPFAGEGNGLFGNYYDLIFWLNNEFLDREKDYIKENFPNITIF